MNPIRLTLVLCIFLTACQAAPVVDAPGKDLPWRYADLRLLSQPSGNDPGLGLIGMYSRIADGDLQIRLDLMDMKSGDEGNFYLALDTHPGGTNRLPLNTQAGFDWDILVIAKAKEEVTVMDENDQILSGLLPRVDRSSSMDSVVIKLRWLPPINSGHPIKAEALAVADGSLDPTSRLGPVSLESLPPMRAGLLLEFWNTLPAGSPAQALRRWDGAHSGPLGQRHGLKPLLDLGEHFGIPMALLDLKTPAALSALDVLGGIDEIRRIYQKGLLILPDATWGDPQAAEASLAYSQSAARLLGLPSSPFLFSSNSSLFGQYNLTFAQFTDNRFIRKNGQLKIIPLPGHIQNWKNPPDADPQATMEGPSLEVRQRLLSAAVSDIGGQLVILGGSLPASTWGDARAAAATLEWIAAHPWIHPLGQADLMTWPACNGSSCQSNLPPCADLLCLEPFRNIPLYTSEGQLYPKELKADDLRSVIRKDLSVVAPGPIRDLAWQAYLALTDPLADPALQDLRAGYLGQIGNFLAASRWEADPGDLSDCSQDLNWDGQEDCILANKDFFGIIERNGARLTLAFFRSAQGLQELTGMSAQFTAGLSDPSTWQQNLGPAGDPEVIPGAFSDLPSSWEPYTVKDYPGRMEFSRAGGEKKLFTLQPDELVVTYEGKGPYEVQIPFVIGSYQRFNPGWANLYEMKLETQRLEWGWNGLEPVVLQSTGSLSIQTFIDSMNLMHMPENPDRSYPAGHFLPFPVAAARIRSSESMTITIRFMQSRKP